MRISVIGCGYLGVVHAAAMTELGHDVVGIDVDEQKIKLLSAAHPPFFEPGLPEVLTSAMATGRLRFSTDIADAHGSQVHFVAVGTPQLPGSYAADLTYVNAAIDALLPQLSAGDLVVGKSTVPVGTAARLAGLVEASGSGASLAWNPEFLREGFAVKDTLAPDRLVYGVARRPAPVGRVASASERIETRPEGLDTAAGGLLDQREAGGLLDQRGAGGLLDQRGAGGLLDHQEAGGELDQGAVDILNEVYAKAVAAGTPVVVTDYATAELVKVSANAFLATKISFINAMAEIAEVTGADVTQLADAIGFDARIGRRFLNAGVGFGGGCLPKDIRAFSARADELGRGESVAFLKEVDAINLRRRQRVVDLVLESLDDEPHLKKVAVLGLAFKPNSDDVRDSPALDVAVQLHGRGATVVATDPEAIPNARRLNPQLTFVEDATDALTDADVVVLVTEWAQFRQLDPVALRSIVRQPVIIDARNCLDAAAWRAAGWTYRGLGRP
ncbi:UDP-glucose dehydrogenase family protein [Rathayibacter soli]|uniref:UDP-glucose dehydrogenase family protein n=1 Tax=Rathayibacter soli TaxID=3144168 RepID=UPI0027E45C73|nr:UDP-glucose/GDP-mannose dehydrogenase family protein [Glaciibacter superstes]